MSILDAEVFNGVNQVIKSSGEFFRPVILHILDYTWLEGSRIISPHEPVELSDLGITTFLGLLDLHGFLLFSLSRVGEQWCKQRG